MSEKKFKPAMKPPTGDQIRAARIKSGLSQVDLARALEVSPQRLQAWESGRAGTKDAGLIERLWTLVEENT